MYISLSRFGRLCLVVATAALAAGVAGCNSSNSGPQHVTLNGAGSTFVYPAMSRWTQAYHEQHPQTQINYQSIGSGGGVQQLKAGTTDFGASDYPLTDDALQQMKLMLQIPETAGPVCITYNLPELKQPLQLSADTLAGIFLGQIKNWRDEQVRKDNPNVNLPDERVVVAYRTDGSGTTAALTTYLSAVSPEWKKKVGQGASVSWPGGIGGKGSEGVTEQVRQTPGAITYVELAYAQQNKLPVASIKNLAGNYVQPSPQSTTAAIAAFSDQLTKDPRVPIVDPPKSAAEAYPISTLTFLIIPAEGTNTAKRSALKGFINYVITGGQATAESLNYAPLPDSLVQYDKAQLNQMTVDGQPVY